MAIKDSTDRFYIDVQKDFSKYSNVREFGVQKYTNEWIFNKLAHLYYKSPKTIENIVFNRVQIKPVQTDLFSNISG